MSNIGGMLLLDVIVKSDYLMQEMGKNGTNKFILAIFKTRNSDTN